MLFLDHGLGLSDGEACPKIGPEIDPKLDYVGRRGTKGSGFGVIPLLRTNVREEDAQQASDAAGSARA